MAPEIRDREYRGESFHLRIEPGVRELVSLFYTSQGTTLKLSGERGGENLEGIHIFIPPEVESNRGAEIARDIATGLGAMRYGYVIAQKTGEEIVPEAEREAALAELRAMGYDLEVSADRKRIQIRKKSGPPRAERGPIRPWGLRMKELLLSVHGTRPRHEILAKSGDF